MPYWKEYSVLPANVFDSMFSSDNLQVDTVEVEGSAALAAIQAECEDAVHSITGAVIGTVGSGSTVTNVVLSSIESGGAYDGAQTNSNMWLNAKVIGNGTNNIGITRRVLTWTFSAGNSFTVDTLPGAPLSGDTFLIIPNTFNDTSATDIVTGGAIATTGGAVDLVLTGKIVMGGVAAIEKRFAEAARNY